MSRSSSQSVAATVGAWSRWSEMDKAARRAAVIALAAENCTASGIAAKLGATRGAVIGFCWRQGLQLPGVSFKVSVSQRREKPGVTLAGSVGDRRPSVDNAIPAGSHGGADHAAGVPAASNSPGSPASPEPTVVASAVGPSCPSASAPAARPSPALRAPRIASGAGSSPPPDGAGEGSVAGPIGFHALSNERCMRPLWPDGPPPRIDAMFFCGAPSEPGSSWCKPCAGRLIAGAPEPARRAWRDG